MMDKKIHLKQNFENINHADFLHVTKIPNLFYLIYTYINIYDKNLYILYIKIPNYSKFYIILVNLFMIWIQLTEC